MGLIFVLVGAPSSLLPVEKLNRLWSKLPGQVVSQAESSNIIVFLA